MRSEREVEFCDFFLNHGSLKWCNFKIFLSYFMHEAWKDAVFPFHVLSWEFYKFQIMLSLQECTSGIECNPLGMLFFFNLGHNLFLPKTLSIQHQSCWDQNTCPVLLFLFYMRSLARQLLCALPGARTQDSAHTPVNTSLFLKLMAEQSDNF